MNRNYGGAITRIGPHLVPLARGPVSMQPQTARCHHCGKEIPRYAAETEVTLEQVGDLLKGTPKFVERFWCVGCAP